MYRKIFMVMAILTILATVSAESSPEIRAARMQLKKCFAEILLGKDPNRLCKTRDDLKKLAVYHSELETKNNNNHTISLNQNFIDILLFTVSHPYVKDFLNNMNCFNATSCVQKKIGTVIKLNKNQNVHGHKKFNIVSMLFTETEEPTYDQRSCDRAMDLRNCMKPELLAQCNAHTAQCILDIFDYSLRHCKDLKTSRRSRAGAADLMPATFLITLTLAVISLLR